MDYSYKNILSFKENEKYKVGAVTYDVTAHFYAEKETLKAKICALLMQDIQKSNLPNKLARGRNGML